MALSKASCTGRGLIPAIGGHVHRMFDEGEDDLFSLSLDDVMDDRPWTADELMGGGARPTSAKSTLTTAPAPAATPAPASVPADDFATRPIMQTSRTPAPAPHPTSDPSETAAFLAAAAQRHTPSGAPLYAAPQQPTYAAPEPTPEPESPVMDLDDLSGRPFALDAWAAADLDETSTGMPALNVLVNPLFAAGEAHDSEHIEVAAHHDRFNEEPRASRIESEGYGVTSSDYDRDPFAAAPAAEYSNAGVKAASASAYTHGTDDERFNGYYVEEDSLRFSEFPQAAKIVFIALVVALLGIIAFEGVQLFRGPTQAESETQQQEDDNEYLDINTLKGDPNDGDDE